MEPEKQKHPDTDTEQAAQEQSRRVQPGAGKAVPPDARRDRSKLRRNQERLGVGPEHKTGAMKKGRRGSFP
jgi:hypothetical protein